MRTLSVAAVVLVILGVACGEALACRIIPTPPVPIIRPPRPPRPPRQPIETRSHTADITIEGPVAKVAVNAVFYNPNPFVMEGTYFFPLAADAAVDNFEMEINGKLVKGELLEAQKAKRIYEDIVRKMRDPGLLEWVGTKMLRCRVFPINPRSEVKVRLNYALTLRRSGDLYEFAYPFRSARPEAGKIGSCAVRVRIKQKQGIKTLYCPTHKVDIQRKGESDATLGFEASGIVPERDFKLAFSVSDKDVGVAVLTHKPAAEDGYFLLTLAPKVEVPKSEVQPKSIVFVLDTSGSMSGEKIRQAKGALRYCVNSLQPEDQFAIVTFSTEPRAFRQDLLPATKENIKAALEFIEGIQARGGTAINDALAMALKTIEGAKGLPMVVFLTDGLPTIGETNTEAILKNAASANKQKARIFAFGVGYDVNTKLLDRLAEDNHGAPDYVSPKEDIEVKVSAFFQKVSSPVLSDLKVEITGLETYDVYPRRLPDLFRGSQIMVLGRYKGSGQKAIKLSGTVRGKPREFVFEATFGTEAENPYLPRLWATRKVAYLLDEIRLHGKNKELEDEVVRLGKRFGIITPYTSFLVVEDGDRPRLARRLREARDRFARAESGRGAFDAAKALGGLKAGAPAQAAPGKPNAVTLAPAAPEAKKELEEAVAEKIVQIADKTFYRRPDGFLYDSLYDEAKHKDKIIEIKAFSDEYFALVRKHPGLGRYLAEGKPMVIVLEGNVYKITTG